MAHMPYADPVMQREYQRTWFASRRTEWIEKNGPCVDCGAWDDLEVDHADASTKVTHRVWSWSKERREAELAKCVVRCGPCHAQKTTAAMERPRGPRNGRTKITEQVVREILASGDPYRVLADRYGISFNVVGRIKRREIWCHVMAG